MPPRADVQRAIRSPAIENFGTYRRKSPEGCAARYDKFAVLPRD